MTFFGSGINNIATAVNNLGYEHGISLTTVVSYGGIRINKLKQVDIRGSESKRRRIVERRFDSHCVSSLYDVGNAHFLSQSDGYTVYALRKSGEQWHTVAREIAVCIGWSPTYHFLFLTVVNVHCEIFVATTVAGRNATVHGFGIYEKFESGTRLAHGRYLVVFPRLEIYVANPGFDVSALRLHCHKTRMHEFHHVANRV